MRNMYQENTLRFIPKNCSGCRKCTEVCPHRVFTMNGKRAQPAHPESCMECGACAKNCPQGAIRVQSGVGCAAAMMLQSLTGKERAVCGRE